MNIGLDKKGDAAVREATTPITFWNKLAGNCMWY